MRLGEQGALIGEHPVALLDVDHLSSPQQATDYTITAKRES